MKEEKEINQFRRFCPNCKGDLFKDVKKKHALGIWSCKSCGGIFFILCTNSDKLAKNQTN